MTHMLKLSLMCATNDGGFLQLMSHGKNHSVHGFDAGQAIPKHRP